MANFVKLLTEESRLNWPEIYKKFTGKEWENPTKEERGIKCETKIEDLQEIDRLMRKPGRGAWHE